MVAKAKTAISIKCSKCNYRKRVYNECYCHHPQGYEGEIDNKLHAPEWCPLIKKRYPPRNADLKQ